jgi:hypothetical protein
MRYHVFTACLCAFVTTASVLQAATTIDTTPYWTPGSGFNKIIYFGGDGQSATYGQVFTVPPEDTELTSFTFYLDDRQDGTTAATKFSAHVIQWAGNRATGSFLYSSPMKTTAGVNGWEEFTFDVGNLPLIPGQQYMALLDASFYSDGVFDACAMGSPRIDVYPGGDFWWSNSGTLSSGGWVQDGNYDTAFKMTLVPEPSTVGAMVIALSVMLSRARRMRRCWS